MGEKQSEDSTCPSIAHKHRFKTRRDAATIISRRHSFGFSMLCRFSRLPSLVAPLPSHSSQQPAWRVVTRTIPTLKVPLLTITAVELNELVKNGTGLVPPCSHRTLPIQLLRPGPLGQLGRLTVWLLTTDLPHWLARQADLLRIGWDQPSFGGSRGPGRP